MACKGTCLLDGDAPAGQSATRTWLSYLSQQEKEVNRDRCESGAALDAWETERSHMTAERSHMTPYSKGDPAGPAGTWSGRLWIPTPDRRELGALEEICGLQDALRNGLDAYCMLK